MRDAQKLRTIVGGLVRRVRVGLTRASGLWRLLGYTDAAGNEEHIENTPTFQGVGFAARPKDSDVVEAIAVAVGGSPNHAVTVATNNRTTREELEADETAAFNSLARVKIDADGKVYVTDRSGGVGVALATLADVQAVVDALYGHEHDVISEGSPTSGGPSVPSPTGTSVLRGQ